MSHKQTQQLIDLANRYATADDQAEANYYLYSFDPENLNHLGAHNKETFKPTAVELTRLFFPLLKHARRTLKLIGQNVKTNS